MGDILTHSVAAQQQRARWAAGASEQPSDDDLNLLRLLEYPQLLGKTYLDHAGTTQWAKSLTHGFAQLMTEDLFGNPHSESSPSKLSDERIEATREKALRFFGADPEHFDLIFVPNATGAIKLVHDCFRDYSIAAGRHWWYGYHKDAHTSLVGVREGAHKHRCFRYDREVELVRLECLLNARFGTLLRGQHTRVPTEITSIENEQLQQARSSWRIWHGLADVLQWIDSRGLAGAEPHEVGLFAYPGQSNMTGKRYPLDWPARIRKRVRAETFVLLDAAALASTTRLDLSDHAMAPDFTALSFYKIFGFPNLGALIVRKSASKILQSRKYFGGGTVEMVISVNDSWVARKQALHSRLEDGTLPFTSIFALDLAIDTHRKLYGPDSMGYISKHTSHLIRSLYEQLATLRHTNGVSVVVIYKDRSTTYGKPELQGATIALNIQKPIGGLVSFSQVEKEADKQGIYIRSGSLCNPGGLATYLDWSPTQLHGAYAEGHRCSEPLANYEGKALGVVRVSLGAMSVAEDIETFVEFVKTTYVDRVWKTGGPIIIPELLNAPDNRASDSHVPVVDSAVELTSVITNVPSKKDNFLAVVTVNSKDHSAIPRRGGSIRLLPRKAHQLSRLSIRELGEVAGGDGEVVDHGEAARRTLSTKSSVSRLRRVRMSIFGALHLAV